MRDIKSIILLDTANASRRINTYAQIDFYKSAVDRGVLRPEMTGIVEAGTAAPLCPTCRFLDPREVVIAGGRATRYYCAQGIRGAPKVLQCRVYEREPGSEG